MAHSVAPSQNCYYGRDMETTPSNLRLLSQALAERVLGTPLTDWVQARRARGMSWERIASDLRAQEPLLDVTGETLRRWHAARPIQPRRTA